jgi:hypothetical protein
LGTPVHPSSPEESGLTDDQRQQLDRLADLLRGHSPDRLDAFLDSLEGGADPAEDVILVDEDGNPLKRTVYISGRRARTEQV